MRTSAPPVRTRERRDPQEPWLLAAPILAVACACACVLAAAGAAARPPRQRLHAGDGHLRDLWLLHLGVPAGAAGSGA